MGPKQGVFLVQQMCTPRFAFPQYILRSRKRIKEKQKEKKRRRKQEKICWSSFLTSMQWNCWIGCSLWAWTGISFHWLGVSCVSSIFRLRGTKLPFQMYHSRARQVDDCRHQTCSIMDILTRNGSCDGIGRWSDSRYGHKPHFTQCCSSSKLKQVRTLHIQDL